MSDTIVPKNETVVSKTVLYRPMHLTHVIIACVFSFAVVGLSALEVYFVKPFTSAEIFFLVIQNVGILFTSGYFAGKVSLTPSGLTETVSKP